MLEIRSTVKFEEIEAVMRVAAQRHNSNVLVVSHLGQHHTGSVPEVPRDAFVFTLCFSKHYTALLNADIRFSAFLPCRVAVWPHGVGVTLQALAPSEYCHLLGRPELAPLAAPLEKALRDVLEDARQPLIMSAHSYHAAEPSNWGATEDQVNMRMAVPQRIDCRGTKVEDQAGTGKTDTLGG